MHRFSLVREGGLEVEREPPPQPELEVGECGGGGHVGHRGHHCWAWLKRKQGRSGGLPGAEPRAEAASPQARCAGDYECWPSDLLKLEAFLAL